MQLDHESAIIILSHHFTWEQGVIRPKASHCPTSDEWEAIDHLCSEWDYLYNSARLVLPDAKPKRSQRCVCGTDMPGTCPGRDNCPYSGDDD